VSEIVGLYMSTYMVSITCEAHKVCDLKSNAAKSVEDMNFIGTLKKV